MIVAHALTEATLDDATTGVELIAAVNDDITRITGNAAYDTVAFYDTASARGATVVVPPAKTARVSPRGPRSSVRDRTIITVKRIGRCRWKKTVRADTRAFLKRTYVDRLNGAMQPLLRLLARGGTLDTRTKDRVFSALADILTPAAFNPGRGRLLRPAAARRV